MDHYPRNKYIPRSNVPISPVQSHCIHESFPTPQPTMMSSPSQLSSTCHKPCKLQLSDYFLCHLSHWKLKSYSSGNQTKPQTNQKTHPQLISVLALVMQLSCCQYCLDSLLSLLCPADLLPDALKESKWILFRSLCFAKKKKQGEKKPRNSFTRLW